MIALPVPPRLMEPTTEVEVSFLVGSAADCLQRGTSSEWVTAASEDFAAYVAARRGVQTRWEVPSSILWYVAGPYYLGSLVIRHELTPVLAEAGGHIGYHVVSPWVRQGHATRMLAAGLVEAGRIGLQRVLLTCGIENEASRRVILANAGVPDGQARGEDRFWIDL
ncbi:hypothetical protein SAMN05892883_0127 [Jatrophihabitans sp. GAS493]|uniref:GNAT family N-acetyltransferase n=1 Tax=Jatrophihabitans sp. GAS493 TaxID=1907575 RepID=UPI000BB69607|nr:GNAT family N-acetyltransferase [Jatrophihabitans sp. GAS493]SOD70427.1 hypothetical protein SAMN05892883_0127 [Jatrophihabitans sp. GAS493]